VLENFFDALTPFTPQQWYDALLWVYFGSSILVFVVLQFFTKASYGRHDSRDRAWWWGPGVPTRTAWIIMEAPSSLGFAVIYFAGSDALHIAPLILFAMWQAHYFQRSFIYPFIRKVRPGDTTPLLVPVLAFTTNLGVSYLNASILSWGLIEGGYSANWLTDPRFILGAALFAIGYHINRKADAMLAALRKPGETGYKIPYGWLYEKVSCPNYFGEFLVWIGWAIATWSLGGAVFVLWTLANLLPRAFTNHQWYRRKFPDYPAQRKAVIPHLL
jgi:steroid 5-alpha-reductase/3-oxo-5-alpha-steroid 4-dehydrogenase 1